MNTLTAVVSLAVFALLACSTNASPCTDTCNGECGLAQGACELTGLLGGLCQTQATVCQTVCGAVCNCVDTCGAQCGGQLAECRGDGSNPLSLVTCGFSFTSCTALCQTQCGFTTLAGVVDQMVKGFSGQP
ncbi:hypothetical protein PoB_000495700 [Plakobranchus ocellatus]|uniref:Uncharacterized protein n=1 Tax=Plakobranchus ocellatus TaxID=259542 RepID=A0AAV3Y6M5_9GAST|nr:hypothetical protein PoB_000495700 [Plakobranchus ocellatus]